MSKFTSDKMLDGVPERERVERFCGHFVDSGNKMHAYRMAFVVDESKATSWVWQQVRELERDPEVQARIQQMRDEANAAQIVSIQKLLQDWTDIADADPNELISLNVDSCRYCHGVDHAYQWKHEDEFSLAYAKAVDETAKVLPSPEGGYGYDPRRAPSHSCPECYGRGIVNAVPHDTRLVSPQARKLLAGVKIGANGALEIKMHDQMKAREQLARVMGYFKDGAIPVVPVDAGKAKPVPATTEDAQKAYMRLISGGAA